MTRFTTSALGFMVAAALPVAAQAQMQPQTAPTPSGAAAPGQASSTTAPSGATSSASATPTVGATVYDSTGAVVGTVDSMAPGAAVINTGTNKVALPLNAIGPGAKGLTASMTKQQLDAAAAQAQAQAVSQMRAKLVPGAKVNGSAGAPVGTVKAADSEYVTLTTPKGDVKLPVNGFGPGPNDTIVIGLTAAQLDAAVAGAKAAPAGS